MRSNLRGNGNAVSFFAFQDVITSVIGIILFIALLLSLFMGLEQTSPDQQSPPLQEASAEAIASLDALTVEIARLQGMLRQAKAAQGAGGAVEIELLKEELVDLRNQAAAAGPSESQFTETPTEILTDLEALGSDAAASKRELDNLQNLAKEAAERVEQLELRLRTAEAAKLEEESKKNELFLIPEKSGTTKTPVLLDVTRDAILLHTLDGAKSSTSDVSKGELNDLLANFPKTEYYVVAYFRPATFHLSGEITNQLRALGYEIGFDVIRDDQAIQFRPSNP